MEILAQFFDLVVQLFDVFIHLDKHLNEVIQSYGAWTYVLLFVIVFCETGLVITPFLPGDSLLFAAGTFAAMGSLQVLPLIVLLLVAAILGDATNYSIGHFLGPKVLTSKHWFLKREYLEKTHRFYERYGGKTIVIARFVPMVRTFAPFLAGVGKMTYLRFATYNVAGAVAWVLGFVLAGFYFGNIPIVKRNFTLVILMIIFISVLPGLIEYWRAKKDEKPNGVFPNKATLTGSEVAARSRD